MADWAHPWAEHDHNMSAGAAPASNAGASTSSQAAAPAPFDRLTPDLLLRVLVRATPVPDDDLDYASGLGQLMRVKKEWAELILSMDFWRRQLALLRERHPGLPVLPDRAFTMKILEGLTEEEKRFLIGRRFAMYFPVLQRRLHDVEQAARIRSAHYGDLIGAFQELHHKIFVQPDRPSTSQIIPAVFDANALDLRIGEGGETLSPAFWLAQDRLLFLLPEHPVAGSYVLAHKVVTIQSVSITMSGEVSVVTAETSGGPIETWVSLIDWAHNTGEVTAGRRFLRNQFPGMADEAWNFSFCDELGKGRDNEDFYGPFLGRVFGFS